MNDGKRLTQIFRELSESRRAALLDFAEYLAGKEAKDLADLPAQTPLDIPRPAEENVVKAIQRLMRTYPMLERNKIFHEASAQMTRHLIHGVSAVDAIDELERVFRRQYEAFSLGAGGQDSQPDDEKADA
jgi:hypothetical protein